MMKKILKMFNHTVTFLLFFMLIVTLFMVIAFRGDGGEAHILGYQLKTVLSGSMEPEIQTGSIISIKQGGDMTRFEEGDVITYTTPDDVLVTHRIDEVIADGDQYITKGDNNEEEDSEPVLAQNIIGTYTGFTLPYVGYVMNFASTGEGAALLLIIPGIILIGYSAVTIWRALKQIEGLKTKEASKENREIL